jgi:hypothetical protein
MSATDVLAPQRNGSGTAIGRLGALLERLVELDFSAAIPFAFLAVAYIGSRIFWLDLGYGTDPDAWRVALTVEHLWSSNEYLPSRLPGYPVQELATALAIKALPFLPGWVVANLASTIVSLAGVYLFACIARRLDVPNQGAITLGFAFAPLIWINSVTAMDYLWGLTFILGAYLALIEKSPRAAGICLGLAAGCRLTSLIMFVPFWFLLWRNDERKLIRPFTFTTILATLVAFSPVLIEYGINFMNFYDQSVQLEEFVKRLGKDGLGIVGAAALLIAIVISLPRLRAYPGDLRKEPHVVVWSAVIVLYFLSYTRLPHEIAYLVPLFPFGFFLMARYFSRGVLVATLAVIAVAGWVDVTSPVDTIGLSVDTFTEARLGKGMLLSDIETRRNQEDFARELRELTVTNEHMLKPAIVITGFIYPELAVLHEDELDGGILERDVTAISQLSDKGIAEDVPRQVSYVWLLEYEKFRELQEAGHTIYITADAERSTFAVHGYRPAYYGAIELPMSRQNPSLGAGTATSDR